MQYPDFTPQLARERQARRRAAAARSRLAHSDRNDHTVSIAEELEEGQIVSGADRRRARDVAAVGFRALWELNRRYRPAP